MEMDRRSFFKVLGGGVAAAALPTVLLDVLQPVPAGAVELGLIREVSAYDLSFDGIALRMDVLAEGIQLSCGSRVTREEFKNEERMAHVRSSMKELLENEMKHRGIAWADLKPLPLPAGYKPVAIT